MSTIEKLNRVEDILEAYYPHKPEWYTALGWLLDQVLDDERGQWIHDPDTVEGKAKFDELLPQAWVGARVHDLRKNAPDYDALSVYKREDGSFIFHHYATMPKTAGGEYDFWFGLVWDSGEEPYFYIDIGHGARHQWAGLELASGDPDDDAVLDIILPGWRDVLRVFSKTVKSYAATDSFDKLPVGESVDLD